MQNKLTYFTTSFILIFIIAVFVSCGSDDVTNNITNPPEPVDTSDFQYPFTTGTNWSYTLTRSAENIRPDSIRYYFNSYPVTGNGYSEVLYDTVIPLGGPVRVIFDRIIIGNDTTASRYYYTQNEYSMVCYGYRGSTSASFPFRKLHDRSIYPTGLFSTGIENMAASDTFMVINPPVIVLKYPVVKNTTWITFNFGTSNISKKYISWENYHLDTATIACIKTQRIWSSEPDYVFYDYHSKYGQMKRDYLSRNKAFKNQNGFTIGFYDKREIYNVTSFNISNK